MSAYRLIANNKICDDIFYNKYIVILCLPKSGFCLDLSIISMDMDKFGFNYITFPFKVKQTAAPTAQSTDAPTAQSTGSAVGSVVDASVDLLSQPLRQQPIHQLRSPLVQQLVQ